MEAIYTAYQAIRASGKDVSEAEKVAAMAAAVYLTVNCGWTNSVLQVGTRGYLRLADEFGVPHVHPR